MAVERENRSLGRGYGIRRLLAQRRFGRNHMPHLHVVPEIPSDSATREITEALPRVVKKGAITIVGAPIIMERGGHEEAPFHEGEQELLRAQAGERETYYFVVANRPDKERVNIHADFSHVFNALYDEMQQPVGVSYSHSHSYEAYAEDPNLRVLFPPLFYIRVRGSKLKRNEIVKIFVLPTEEAAAEMYRRFENGIRMPLMVVTPDGMPVAEEDK